VAAGWNAECGSRSASTEAAAAHSCRSARPRLTPPTEANPAGVSLMSHARLETTRIYTLPTKADRERALDALVADR
jgi:hypothetical protein